jgi:ribosomal RNA-processing protein 12
MHAELLTTLLVFLGSANREIVKATLGYTKLVAHTLPAALLRPHLPALVAALLRWAGDGRNHFKAKVRHVCERLLRRFGFDVLYAAAESEDGRKVLANIKKRKERAKRKRAAAADGAEDEDAVSACLTACRREANAERRHAARARGARDGRRVRGRALRQRERARRQRRRR